ncbi:MAG TPA: hypothetical protein VM533_17375 [Fimbriiglobus sp.]|jgi:outer membrane protein TolC|nr:hypothetical protein [Fimbriiglobus sp.]
MRTRGPLVLLLAVAAVGCHGKDAPRPAPLPTELLTVERKLAPIDVSRLSTDLAPTGPTAPPGPYHRLTAEECHRLACASSSAARLIDVATESQPRRLLDGTPREADELREAAAVQASREARLRTAAAALELYYQLLEAELLSDVLAESQAEVDELVRAGQVAIEEGVPESEQFLTLRRQQIQLRADRAKLQAGIRRLNTELKSLTGLDHLPGSILPADQVTVTPEPLDAEHAVRVGLATRPDLQLIRTLTAGLNARTVDAVRQAVAGLIPPLAAINTATRVLAPGLRRLIPYLTKPDVQAMRAQLTTLYADREREAVRDIRTAVDEWTSQRELVAIATRRVQLESDRVHELTVKREAGMAVEMEYRLSRLELFKAQADLIREAVKWQRADVKARQAMGLLCSGAEACGEVQTPTPRRRSR